MKISEAVTDFPIHNLVVCDACKQGVLLDGLDQAVKMSERHHQHSLRINSPSHPEDAHTAFVLGFESLQEMTDAGVDGYELVSALAVIE